MEHVEEDSVYYSAAARPLASFKVKTLSAELHGAAGRDLSLRSRKVRNSCCNTTLTEIIQKLLKSDCSGCCSLKKQQKKKKRIQILFEVKVFTLTQRTPQHTVSRPRQRLCLSRRRARSVWAVMLIHLHLHAVIITTDKALWFLLPFKVRQTTTHVSCDLRLCIFMISGLK